MSGFENFIYHLGAWTFAAGIAVGSLALVDWVERVADRADRRRRR